MALGLETDLSIFLSTDDFAVNCTLPNASVIKVLLNTPDQEIFAQMTISADAKALAKTSDITSISTDSQVVIGSTTYSVKKILAIDDGLISEIYLTRE